MRTETTEEASPPTAPSDEEIARRVVGGETELFELIMRRHNTLVYRAVRGFLHDEAEVEDVMQQAYIAAWRHLGAFAGNARFSTWLVRIAVNEALMRLRRTRRLALVEDEVTAIEETPMGRERPTNPEDLAANRELARILERAVDELPDLYRAVFVLREVQGLSTEDTAEALAVSIDVVKTRLRRARISLQTTLQESMRGQVSALYAFEAPRCDRVVAGVMSVIGSGSHH